jgi:hypothetical protein
MSTRKPASKKAAPPGDSVERMLAEMRVDLVEHCGGQPSAVQAALIERISWSSLHLRLLDEKAAAGGTALTAPDRQAFISLSNVLIEALRALGPPARGDRLDLETKCVERIVIDPGGPTARDIVAGRLNRLGREAVEEAEPVPNTVAADALPGATLLPPPSEPPPSEPPATEPVAPAPPPDTAPQADAAVAVLPGDLVALLDEHARGANNRRAAPDQQWGPNPVLDYVDYRW